MQSSARDLLHNLLASPEDFVEHIRLSIGKMVLKITFGDDLSFGFDYIAEAEKAHKVFSLAGSPFAYAVDILPLCPFI